MTKDYNLFEIINLINKICDAHPKINTFFTNVYRLNDSNDIIYPVISLTVNNITRQENTIDYNINILYSDRLTENRDNQIVVQSSGTSAIIEIFNLIENHTNISPSIGYQLTPFTEQFADNTAGIFATLTLKVPNYIGECHWIDIKCIECI